MKSKMGKLFTIDGNVVKLKYPDRGSEMEVNLLNITNIKTRALISGSLRKKWIAIFRSMAFLDVYGHQSIKSLKMIGVI